MMSRQSRVKVGRQNKATSKTRFSMRWEDANYDYLIQRSRDEGLSVAALANQLIRRLRQSVPHGTVEAS